MTQTTFNQDFDMTFSVGADYCLRFNGKRVMHDNGCRIAQAQTALFAVALFGEQTRNEAVLQQRMSDLGVDVHSDFDAETNLIKLSKTLEMLNLAIDWPCMKRTDAIVKHVEPKKAPMKHAATKPVPAPVPAPAPPVYAKNLTLEVAEGRLLIDDRPVTSKGGQVDLNKYFVALFAMVVFEDVCTDKQARARRLATLADQPVNVGSIQPQISQLRTVLAPHNLTVSLLAKRGEHCQLSETYRLIRPLTP